MAPNTRMTTTMKNFLGALVLVALVAIPTLSQSKPLSQQAAQTAMTALWRDPARNQHGSPARWTYEHRLV